MLFDDLFGKLLFDVKKEEEEGRAFASCGTAGPANADAEPVPETEVEEVTMSAEAEPVAPVVVVVVEEMLFCLLDFADPEAAATCPGRSVLVLALVVGVPASASSDSPKSTAMVSGPPAASTRFCG